MASAALSVALLACGGGDERESGGGSIELDESLCDGFEGGSIATSGVLRLERSYQTADSMWQCDFLYDDGTGALSYAVATDMDPTVSEGYDAFVLGGTAERIDGLGDDAVRVFHNSVRVLSDDVELVVTVNDYENPNDGGTFADLDASMAAAEELMDHFDLR